MNHGQQCHVVRFAWFNWLKSTSSFRAFDISSVSKSWRVRSCSWLYTQASSTKSYLFGPLKNKSQIAKLVNLKSYFSNFFFFTQFRKKNWLKRKIYIIPDRRRKPYLTVWCLLINNICSMSWNRKILKIKMLVEKQKWKINSSHINPPIRKPFF